MQRKLILLIGVSLSVVVLDQWTKYLVVRALTTRMDDAPTLTERLQRLYGTPPPEGFDGQHFRQRRHITISKDFFRLRYAENPGAAWGLFRTLPKHIRGPLFHLVSIGAVLLISYYFFKLSGTHPSEKWALWGLPLVLGGALGNYVDRIARGFVVDFLEAHWFDKAAWPSFNVADSAICIGVGMLLVDAFVRKEDKGVAESPSP